MRVKETRILLLNIVLLLATSALAEARWALTPRFRLEGQYNDNIYLNETDKKEDFISTVSPGIHLEYLTPADEILLDYEFRQSFFHELKEPSFSSHYGNLEATKEVNSWLGVGVRDVFVHSEDPLELTGEALFNRPSVRTGRRFDPYTRNTVQPETTLRFGEKSHLRLGYRNIVLRNEGSRYADQDLQAGNARLSYRPNPWNEVALSFEYVWQNYSITDPSASDRDYQGSKAWARYTRYLNPRTSLFLEYRFNLTDYLLPTPGFPDYQLHEPRIGVSYAFSKPLSVTASGGYVLRSLKARKTEGTFSGRLQCTGRTERLTLDLLGEAGFDQDTLSAEVLGFFRYWRTGFEGRYRLLERLWVQGSIYYEEDEFLDIGRTDRFLYGKASASYQLLRWLFLSAAYMHLNRDTTAADPRYDDESFVDNRYAIQITCQYELADLFR